MRNLWTTRSAASGWRFSCPHGSPQTNIPSRINFNFYKYSCSIKRQANKKKVVPRSTVKGIFIYNHYQIFL
jgi:hypothetical protein